MAQKGKLNMEFVVDTTKPVKSIKELQNRIETLRDSIEGAPLGSAEFNQLTGQLSNASSEMKVLEKNMEGLEPQQKAEAFLKMGEGIAGAFAVGQGAMALMGVESKNLEKLQVKVQSAIAIATGIRMMSEAALMMATARRVAMEKIAIVQTKIGTAINKAAALGAWLYTAGLKGVGLAASVSTKGMHVLKAAIISTGIGALIVAVGTLFAYWDDIKAAVTGVSKEMREQLDAAELLKNTAIINMEANENSVQQLKLAGKSQKEILEMKLLDIKAAIKASEILAEEQIAAKKQAVETAEMAELIVMVILGMISSPLAVIMGAVDALTYGLSLIGVLDEGTNLLGDVYGWGAGMLGFDSEATRTEMENSVAESEKGIAELKEKSAGLQNELNALGKEGSDTRTDITEEGLQEQLDALDKFLDEYQATMDDYLQTAEEKEINAVRDKYERLIAEAKKYGLITLDLEEQKQALIKEIEDKYQKERDDAKAASDLKIAEANQKEIDDAEALEDEILAAKLSTLTSSLDAINANMDARVSELDNAMNRELEMEGLTTEQKEDIQKKYNKKKEKIDKRQKAIAAAQAIISTYQSAVSAYNSVVGIVPIGPVLAPIAAGAAVVAGLASVRQIYAQDVGGGGGGGGGGVTAPPSAPAPKVGSFTLSGEVDKEKTIKAYVVTDEMTDSQSQLEDIREDATI